MPTSGEVVAPFFSAGKGDRGSIVVVVVSLPSFASGESEVSELLELPLPALDLAGGRTGAAAAADAVVVVGILALPRGRLVNRVFIGSFFLLLLRRFFLFVPRFFFFILCPIFAFDGSLFVSFFSLFVITLAFNIIREEILVLEDPIDQSTTVVGVLDIAGDLVDKTIDVIIELDPNVSYFISA
ncbi:hypothetical protein PG990_014319 [Apiospora arundinis]